MIAVNLETSIAAILERRAATSRKPPSLTSTLRNVCQPSAISQYPRRSAEWPACLAGTACDGTARRAHQRIPHEVCIPDTGTHRKAAGLRTPVPGQVPRLVQHRAHGVL